MDELHSVRSIRENRAAEVAWRRLSSFQDIDRATEKLMTERKLVKRHRENVRKQMEQLAFSIGQAREFFNSAGESGSSTKALLAYYGLMSLANAEVLWRGDGMSSFDARSARFNAHGFDLIRAPSLLDYSASALIDAQGLKGMFGLWRKYATHTPHYGKMTWHLAEGGTTVGLRAMSTITALQEIPYPTEAISLGFCLQNIPGISAVLDLQDKHSLLCRGYIEQEAHLDDAGKAYKSNRSYVLHHATPQMFEDIGGKFQIEPNVMPDVEARTLGQGFLVKLHIDPHAPLVHEHR